MLVRDAAKSSLVPASTWMNPWFVCRICLKVSVLSPPVLRMFAEVSVSTRLADPTVSPAPSSFNAFRVRSWVRLADVETDIVAVGAAASRSLVVL